MPIVIEKITVNNSKLSIENTREISELKKDLAEKLDVKVSDIHFTYTEKD